MSAWIVLLIAGGFEAVWATALGKSDGLSRLIPSLIFLAGAVASTAGLAWAMRTLPAGTSYAVWTGVGAALTVTYAMATGAETASAVRVGFIIGIVACVIGLEMVT
ncbi:DMT family transporter [Nocardia aobensis]|uniref:DMT family transporter n=1 Tax=Nocardia aobensis TaxID=257277 RepID=A0ABW6P571_9NOCA